METIIVVMLKNKKTGFFEEELTSIPISENEDLLLNIFAYKEDDRINIHIKLTTNRDVLDWEYNAIFDYYNLDIFKENLKNLVSFTEVEGEYNPTWQIVINYKSDEIEKDLYNILSIHKEQLNYIYESIKDKKGEYENYGQE